MIANIITRVGTVVTAVELIGVTEDEFRQASDGELEDDLDLDFLAVGSEVKVGDRVIGRVVSVDCPVTEQYIESFTKES